MEAAALSALCSRISSGGTPSRQHPEYFSDDGGHLWVKSQELIDRPISDTSEKISDLGLKNSSAKYFDEDTVLIAMYGATVGQLAILKVPATVNQAICGLSVDPEIADYRYVFYALMATRHDLTVQAAGAAQQNLNQGLIRDFEIPIFPLGTQRCIARVLGGLDDLIENNRRRIQILDEMARLIYREWFVHFRFPGHEGVEVVDSDLGPIPEHWSVGRLSDVLELAYGKALKAEVRRNGPAAVYGSGGIVGWHNEALVQGPGIVVGRKGNVGAVYWSDVDFYPIDTTYFVKTRLPFSYVYHQLQTLEFIDSHAAVPGLSRDQAYGLKVLIPTSEVLAKFDEVVTPTYGLRRNLLAQNNVLSQARDLLLPRLISGELNVSDLDLDLEPVA